MEKLTREQVRQKYLELEKKGIFDEHVDPIDYSIALPVDASFHYFPEGLREHLKRFFVYSFVAAPTIRDANSRLLETEVVGKENLKGIKSAIVVCNHVEKYDCVAMIKAVRPHKLNIVAASFNNFRGSFGEGMRASGMLPLPTKLSDIPSMRNFNDAVERALKKNHYVLFFPEQSEWWYYPKPRPYKDGAFYYAVKNKVPVVPSFITFAPRKKKIKDPEGTYPSRMIVHLLSPVYPKPNISLGENRTYLKETAFEECKACYEETYGKALSYNE
jgi:1-acyl-sn-glycerol-3-phosphate acyltransferase